MVVTEIWIPQGITLEDSCLSSLKKTGRVHNGYDGKPFKTDQSTAHVIVAYEHSYCQWSSVPQNVRFILVEDTPITQDYPSVFTCIPRNASSIAWKTAILRACDDLKKDTQIQSLQKSIDTQKFSIGKLNEIGVALAQTTELDQLLNLIIDRAMEIGCADAGSLYLIERTPGALESDEDFFQGKRFRFEITKNYSRNINFSSTVLPIDRSSIYGYVALEKQTLVIDDVYEIPEEETYHWGGKDFDRQINYRTKSMVTVPMFVQSGPIIGVIQLINCKSSYREVLGNPDDVLKKVIPYESNMVSILESVAAQAAMVLHNKRLVDSIQVLFDGFINASVRAIESRDPTTSGHSSRVAALTLGIAEAVQRQQTGKFAHVKFTSDQLHTIRYASLLHDFGKIGVRESVLVKAKKLYPDELEVILNRFGLIRKHLQLQSVHQQLRCFMNGGASQKAMIQVNSLKKELQNQLVELDSYLEAIIQCNEPTVLAKEGFEQLHHIAKLGYVESQKFMPYLLENEVESLSIPKGTLTQKDREEIESHVTHTYNFLRMIPWSKNLIDVPNIAYAHHEKLNGSGYPRQLQGDQIPLQSCMMTIADIYDALTAWDRPYKKAIPEERALDILKFEAKDSHIDSDLLDIFIEAKLYKIVAHRFDQK